MCAKVVDWVMESSSSGHAAQEERQQHNPTTAAAAAPAASLQGPCGQQQRDMEAIQSAFTPVAVLGIRSLPDALHPGYRLELLMQLQAAERQRRTAAQLRQQTNSHASCSGAQHNATAVGNSCSPPRAASAFGSIPQRYGPMQGLFSCYSHITSEYGRRDMLDKFARLNSKLQQLQMSPDDFVVRGTPPPHPHSTTFAHYDFDQPPFEEVDHLGRPIHSQQQQQFVQGPPFIPAGRGCSPETILRGQTSDMLARLDAQLSKDWPRSFLKAFTDEEGAVVLSFDRASAAREGDLTGYLNHQEKHGTTMVESRLSKDPSQWGVVENRGTSVFYVLLPPWCRNKQTGQH